jgi:signal peptidase I
MHANEEKTPMTSDSNLKATRPRQDQFEEPMGARGEMGEFFKTAIIAVLLALTIRTFLYEPFNIPSGSMMPTLEIGDYLFVSKPAYGYSKYSFPFGIVNYEGREFGNLPQRGDVAVFKLPTNTSIDYIKRIVGLPGDKIQVINGRLHINGKMVERETIGLKRVDKGFGPEETMTEYIETLPGGAMHRIYEESDNAGLDNTGIYTVPENHYFMMGDNRDNSQDSRVQDLVGFVPLDNIVGRADFLFFSVNEDASLFKPWRWPFDIRYSRIFDGINPVRPEPAQE